jgi:hypothetical protein
MADVPIVKISHRKRNMGIAAAVIVVVVVASIAYFEFFSNGGSTIFTPPFDFSLTVNQALFAKQFLPGDRLVMAAINVNSNSSETKLVELTASGGPDGTILNFTQNDAQIAELTPNATCSLWINIPSSAAVGDYSITVSATGGGKTYSVPSTITILKTNVTAYGSIYIQGEETSGAHATAVNFYGQYESRIYSANIVGDTYSVVLRNQQSYAISVEWVDSSGETGSFLAGSIDVNAPLGLDSIGLNLTNLPSS